MRLTGVILILLCVSCRLTNWEERKFKENFGTAFNEQRKKLGAHPVTGGMRLDENLVGARYIYVNRHQPGMKRPDFVRKVVIVDRSVSQITHESDIYYNPIEQKELAYEFAIVRQQTIITLQDTRDPERIRYVDDPGISFQTADSILRAWGIEPPEHL